MGSKLSVGRVAVLGDINLDIIAFHSRFPSEGGEEVAEKAYIGHGGSGANIAHALALLGADAVMIGCVGDDPLGAILVKGLEDVGVDTSHIQRTRLDATGVVYVVVCRGGERTMLAYRGANRYLKYEMLGEGFMNGVKALHISGYCFLEGEQRETAFKILENGGRRLHTMDMCIPLASQTTLLDRIARLLDCVFINVPEFSLLSRHIGVETVSDLALRWGCMVVLKKGRDGCEISTKNGELVRLPAESVEPVDTTGAGDAFTAGFIYELMRGSTPIQCGLTAVRVGALASKTVGGRLERV
ncbi:MAG: carbohydrate kinase family protein [Nitrososphaerota archaeon]